MAGKITITLSDYRDAGIPGKEFIVESLTNTVMFTIGERIRIETAEGLCKHDDYDVKIIKLKG